MHRHVFAQRGEAAVEQRLVAAFGERRRQPLGAAHLHAPSRRDGRNRLELAVAGEHRGGGLAPHPARPEYPSASSPTSASQSGMDARRDAELRDHPRFVEFRRRRSKQTMRRPRTHCARSLSGVQITTCSASAAKRAAPPVASASSASNSTIGQTTRPSAADASSASGNCASSSPRHALAGLVSGVELVAKRLDHVIGRAGDVRRPLRLAEVQQRRQHPARRSGLTPVGRLRGGNREEGSEQLVGGVDEVDLRRGRRHGFSRRKS